MKNVFADLAEIQATSLGEELVEVLASVPSTRIERIVSSGHQSPAGFWYDQDEDEWVLLLRGRATLTLQVEAAGADGDFDGVADSPSAPGDPGVHFQQVELVPGDHLMIPAQCRHRVDRTSPDEPTVWLAVFIAREGKG